MKFLRHFSDQKLIDISVKSVAELLEYLITNQAEEQIKNATEKWMSNQLEVIGKYDVVAEDITVINHVRGESFKNFAYSL